MNEYYIHGDKTIEFMGTNPVVDESTILQIAEELSEIPDPDMERNEDELLKGAPWNQPCTYCDSKLHKWENCPDANDDDYDNIKQDGVL